MYDVLILLKCLKHKYNKIKLNKKTAGLSKLSKT